MRIYISTGKGVLRALTGEKIECKKLDLNRWLWNFYRYEFELNQTIWCTPMTLLFDGISENS